MRTASMTTAKTVFGRITLALLIASNGFFMCGGLRTGFYTDVSMKTEGLCLFDPPEEPDEGFRWIR